MRLPTRCAAWMLEADSAGCREPGHAKSLVVPDLTALAMAIFPAAFETTRAYAFAKLAESGELPEVARRHAEYFRMLLESIENEWEKRSTPPLHLDNARAALEWCFGAMGSPAIGVRLAATVVPIFLAMSLLPECHRWSERALRALDDHAPGGVEEMHLQASLGVSSVCPADLRPKQCCARRPAQKPGDRPGRWRCAAPGWSAWHAVHVRRARWRFQNLAPLCAVEP